MAFNTRELEDLLAEVPATVERLDNGELSYKPDETKWSKKEILGHLTDSAFYNLKRFTEVLYEAKPYKIELYNQDELVRVNQYQIIDIEDILSYWACLNKRIVFIIRAMSEAELALFVHLPDNSYQSVEWIIEDYIAHLKHHLNQIFDLK